MDPNGTDANGSAPVIKAKFSGLFSSKAYNHAIHSIGPAPFMPQHMSAAMQRPWNSHDDANNTSPEDDTLEPALNGHRSGSAADKVSSQERMPAAAQAGDLAAALQAPADKENLQVPPLHTQMKDEDPWWDIFPKLSMCAMTQFGCCAGNDQTKSIARRKALCGVGIVFTEANHGALVVQQVVPR